MTKYKYINKGTGLSSFAVALFASVPTLNMIITRIIPGTEGIMMVTLYILSYLLILVSTIKVSPTTLPSKWLLFVLAAVTLAFIFTQTPGIPTQLKTPNFLVFTIIPLLIPQLVKVDAARTVALMMILPSFGILFVTQIFTLSDYGSIEMDLTYSFLTPIVATFVYLSVFYKQSNQKTKIKLFLFLFINVVYFLFCFLFGSRAASLSIILCIVFLACTKTEPQRLGFRIRPVFWLVFLLVCILVVYFKEVLYLTSEALRTFGIDSYQMDKMITLYEMGDITDGRSEINELAIKGIIKSPLYGYGLSASQPITNYAYPHNFILQLLLDGGILLFAAIMLPMISNLIRLKRKGTMGEYLLIITLFFASVPGALFSLDVWENPRFWLFMGFLLSAQFRNTCIQNYNLNKEWQVHHKE